MKGIPLFKEGLLSGKEGFTLDGVGYYARHLESHRLLYGASMGSAAPRWLWLRS